MVKVTHGQSAGPLLAHMHLLIQEIGMHESYKDPCG